MKLCLFVEQEYAHNKFIGAYLSGDGLMANLYQRIGKKRVYRGFYSLSTKYKEEDFESVWPAINDTESFNIREIAAELIIKLTKKARTV